MSNFTYRPPSYLTVHDENLRVQLDKDISTIFSAHGLLSSTSVQGPTNGSGFTALSGATNVTGSKLSVPTGLASITNVTGSLNTGATPHNFTLSITPSKSGPAGSIDIYVFQPTSASVNTPVPATTAQIVNWWATGPPAT